MEVLYATACDYLQTARPYYKVCTEYFIPSNRGSIIIKFRATVQTNQFPPWSGFWGQDLVHCGSYDGLLWLPVRPPGVYIHNIHTPILKLGRTSVFLLLHIIIIPALNVYGNSSVYWVKSQVNSHCSCTDSAWPIQYMQPMSLDLPVELPMRWNHLQSFGVSPLINYYIMKLTKEPTLERITYLAGK